LYGDFAIVLYDGREKGAPKIHLIRDHAGVKPLYIARTASGEWLFGSEIRALLAHPDLPMGLDRTAVWHYLTFIVAPAPLTRVGAVFKLAAGGRATIEHLGRAKAEQWWDCKPDARETLKESDSSYDEACEELRGLLRQSIARRMVSG